MNVMLYKDFWQFTFCTMVYIRKKKGNMFMKKDKKSICKRVCTLMLLILGINMLIGCGILSERNTAGEMPQTKGCYVEKKINMSYMGAMTRNHNIQLMEDGSFTESDWMSDIFNPENKLNGLWITRKSTADSLDFEEEKIGDAYGIPYLSATTILSSGERLSIINNPPGKNQDFVYEDKDGNVEYFSLNFDESNDVYAGMGIWIFAGEDNCFYASVGNCIYRILPLQQRKEYIFCTDSDSDYGVYLAVCGDYIYAISKGKLYMYSLSEERLVENDKVLQAALPSGSSSREFYSGKCSWDYYICGERMGERIYLITHDGIFAHVPFGNTMEQIMDASFYSYGDSAVKVAGMKVKNDENDCPIFWVLLDDTAYISGEYLSCFYYDKEAVLTEKENFRIYSLYDNEIVKEAASKFGRIHKDVNVSVEIGITDGSSTTKSDALKNLSTELASGNGPDVIFMDKLPLQSYIEKGILQDITDIKDGLTGVNALVPNVADGYVENGRTFAIPLSFTFATVAGEREYLDGVHTLKEFADAVIEAEKENSNATLLAYYDARTALQWFSATSYGDFIDEDGHFNKEGVREYLSQVYRIYKARESNTDLEGIIATEAAMNNEIDLCGVLGTINTATCGLEYDVTFRVGTMSNTLADITRWMGYMKISEKDMTYIPMPGSSQNSYIPKNLLSINAATKMPKLCQQFVKYCLSSGFQTEAFPSNSYTELLPVNKDALLKWDQSSTIGNEIKIYYGSELEYKIAYPAMTYAELDDLKTMIMQLDKMQYCPEEVYERVIEEGERALLDEITIEEAVDAIEQSVQIYLAE